MARGGGVLAAIVAASACGRLRFDPMAPDASTDAAAATVYNDITDPSLWSTFDPSTVDAGAKGFVGGVFDGRYVYFVPYNNGAADGVVARYDTQAAFTAGASWSVFDTTSVNAQAKGFAGATFDGRYIYLIPNFNGTDDGIVARYDTHATFTTLAAWSSFDTATVSAALAGYQGATFDGRYVYLAPWSNGAFDGVAARYDTQAPFAVGASWSSFDLSAVNAGARGLFGTTFDGRYVYYAPDYNGAFDGIAARYDTQAPFAVAASWSTFDATTLDANANGFAGTVFDGHHVYLVPQYNAKITQYDTSGAFTASASWSVFDATTVSSASGYFGGAFDGRYVYFVPLNSGAVARYDVEGTFTAAGSWSTFDTISVNTAAKNFHGAVFDGRYVYLVASGAGTMARFDAKTPPSLPPEYTGSFF